MRTYQSFEDVVSGSLVDRLLAATQTLTFLLIAATAVSFCIVGLALGALYAGGAPNSMVKLCLCLITADTVIIGTAVRRVATSNG